MVEKAIDIADFFQITKEDLQKKILTTISDEKIASLVENGNLIRPILTPLVFKTCTLGKEKQDLYQNTLEIALSIELINSASALNDDIIDKNKKITPIMNHKDTFDDSILLGHRILALGFNIVVNHGDEIAKLYLDAWDDILTGGINETNQIQKNIDITENYNEIINMKTASLFSLACKAGAIEAESSDEIQQVFSEYGREIGLAYQLTGDLVNFIKRGLIDSMRFSIIYRMNTKSTTDPLKEKPLIKQLPKQKSKVKQIYLDEIKKHIKKAEEISKSKIIPQSFYKKMLNMAPSFIINQVLSELEIIV